MSHPTTQQEILDYINGLHPNERVIDIGKSAMYLRTGTVYLGEEGGVCVLWDKHPGEKGQMGTSVTWGTRRLSDLAKTYQIACEEQAHCRHSPHAHPKPLVDWAERDRQCREAGLDIDKERF